MVKRLTEVWKACDGSFHETEDEANRVEIAHVTREELRRVIREARFHDFGEYHLMDDSMASSLASALFARGFRLEEPAQ